jgi:hypothetical protein
MKNATIPMLLCLAVLYGCAAGTVSPGPTLLTGIKRYEAEMQSYGSSYQRWPERQRAGGELKTAIVATLGGSREFFRLVDMDLKRREYLIAMRESVLRPDRLQEMKVELAQMAEEANQLRPIVKAQMAESLPLPEGQRIEAIATQGLLGIALDSLFLANGARSSETRSITVDQYVVTDLGAFSTVRAPGGPSYRCALFGTDVDGAGIRCEPLK